jgi:ring-1,2-phenylacetyl-CoA epoxidase subunit PaaE
MKDPLFSKVKLIQLNAAADNEYYICGPGPMMDNVKAALPELNVPEEKIHIEYFTTPVSTGEEKKEHVVAASSPAGNVATIIFEKETHEIVLEDNETILEAAIRIDLDPPFACQGGSCCTCRALLEEGEVDMEVNYGLSKSEVKKGFILTCQSRPTTSKVTVNYDKG